MKSCQDAPKSIRKWWKSWRKTNVANLRNCQSCFQLWANGRGSQYFSVCFFQTYMKEDIQYCRELFSKNTFSDAQPLYNSHLSMAGLYENNWAKWFQLTVSDGNQQNRTKILTQFLFSYCCLVYIEIEPGQYFIEQILLKIPNKANYNKICQKKNNAEFLAFPLLLKEDQ